MAGKKSVSIVIPNYNGKNLLQEYLPHTIDVIEASGANYEIIVVDDASTDDSVTFMQTAYPQVKLLVNEVNSGFSHSCNRGIFESKCDLVLLLNSDVKLLPGYFDEQWKYFDDPETFGVQGRIIDMDGDRIQEAGRIPKFNGLKLKTDYFYYTEQPNDSLYTFYLMGANALIDATKLKQTRGFYELFSPFYCEDMELSIRAWRLGWKCYYEHQSVCRHRVSASTKNYKSAKWVKSVYYRNRFYMHALHLDGLALLGWYAQITLVDLLPKLLVGQFWIWKSYLDLFKNHKLISEYKTRLKDLLHKNNSRLSIFNIVNNIRASVKDKALIKIKL